MEGGRRLMGGKKGGRGEGGGGVEGERNPKRNSPVSVETTMGAP